MGVDTRSLVNLRAVTKTKSIRRKVVFCISAYSQAFRFRLYISLYCTIQTEPTLKLTCTNPGLLLFFFFFVNAKGERKLLLLSPSPIISATARRLEKIKNRFRLCLSSVYKFIQTVDRPNVILLTGRDYGNRYYPQPPRAIITNLLQCFDVRLWECRK